MDNLTLGDTFLLAGLSGVRELQVPHAVLFLAAYLAALLGNLLIGTLTTWDPQLRSPMYFFLRLLSSLDLGLISITVPKSIANSLRNRDGISFLGRVSQVFFFFLLATTEVALLTVMSYDRYVAICHPLRYEVVTGPVASVQVAASSWLSGALNAILRTAATFSVPMMPSGERRSKAFSTCLPHLVVVTLFFSSGLRNKDVKMALRRLRLGRGGLSS
ncbi:olfactory receptor 14L1-like [Ctenodactylus gundi]